MGYDDHPVVAHTRYVMLVKVTSKDTQTVVSALTTSRGRCKRDRQLFRGLAAGPFRHRQCSAAGQNVLTG